MMESSNIIAVANDKKWINKLIGVRASMETLTRLFNPSVGVAGTKYVQLQQ